ncbi:MAG: hypothetical protein LUE86_03025 [Clostridiales bacterium]|nr:hypothetical protein [Clostridiales bacterium]
MRCVRDVVRLAAAVFFLSGVLTVAGVMHAFAAPDVTEDDDSELLYDLELDEEDEAFEEFLRQSDGELFQDAEEAISQQLIETELVMSRTAGGKIRYTFPNGNSFTTTTPRGMITTGPVEFNLSSGVECLVMKGPDQGQVPESFLFTETGVYHLRFFCYQAADTGSEDYNLYESNYYFTIIGDTDGSLGAIMAPEGFVITVARRDGKAQEITHENCFFLFGDGRYEIQYADQATGTIRLETVFNRDTTAPFLTFSQELEDGTAKPPLDFYPSEQNCQIWMNYEGEASETTRQTLTAPGNYELTVSDAVGNRRTYRVRVRQVFQLLDIRMVGAGLIVLAGVLVRLWYLRRHMEVL